MCTGFFLLFKINFLQFLCELNDYHNRGLLCCWVFYIAMKFTTQFPLYRFEYLSLGITLVKQKQSVIFNKVRSGKGI